VDGSVVRHFNADILEEKVWCFWVRELVTLDTLKWPRRDKRKGSVAISRARILGKWITRERLIRGNVSGYSRVNSKTSLLSSRVSGTMDRAIREMASWGRRYHTSRSIEEVEDARL
jgi:hypothetical protein